MLTVQLNNQATANMQLLPHLLLLLWRHLQVLQQQHQLQAKKPAGHLLPLLLCAERARPVRHKGPLRCWYECCCLHSCSGKHQQVYGTYDAAALAQLHVIE
jgi:hypothetical protein